MYWPGATKAEASNQRSIRPLVRGQLAGGDAVRELRPVPVFRVLVCIVGVNGSPVWNVAMVLICQPPAIHCTGRAAASASACPCRKAIRRCRSSSACAARRRWSCRAARPGCASSGSGCCWIRRWCRRCCAPMSSAGEAHRAEPPLERGLQGVVDRVAPRAPRRWHRSGSDTAGGGTTAPGPGTAWLIFSPTTSTYVPLPPTYATERTMFDASSRCTLMFHSYIVEVFAVLRPVIEARSRDRPQLRTLGREPGGDRLGRGEVIGIVRGHERPAEGRVLRQRIPESPS